MNEMIKTLQQFLRDYEEKDKLVKELQDKVKVLEEDILHMRKVSHIVALERENSSLKEQLAKMKLSVATPPKAAMVAPLEVYEKTIKGIVYYIDDNLTIYKKNEDDSIGESLGKLIREEGKTRVQWN
jgi:hypothetical protein